MSSLILSALYKIQLLRTSNQLVFRGCSLATHRCPRSKCEEGEDLVSDAACDITNMQANSEADLWACAVSVKSIHVLRTSQMHAF